VTVITVGAGASPLVGELLADGVHVIAVDIATAALDTLAAELGYRGVDVQAARGDGRLRLLTADVRRLHIGDTVDGWHDRAVFHFLVDEADRSSYVTAAAAAVRRGGHLVIATFAPGGPEECSGLSVMRHDAGSLADAFGRHFDLVESFEADHVTPWSSTQRFTHAVFARR
jgi:hypothetical protein